MSRQNKIDYVEFATSDIQSTKAFFETVFGWTFVDYGDEYTSFAESGVKGGFFNASETGSNNPLIVLFSEDLEQSQKSIEASGGKITKPIFDFPGGKRFQFTEPGGNELAVWTEV